MLDTKNALLRLRMRMRARLADKSGPPNFFVKFPPAGHELCDSHRATMQGGGVPAREYFRDPGETLDAFEARIANDFPVRALPRAVIFWPGNDAQESA